MTAGAHKEGKVGKLCPHVSLDDDSTLRTGLAREGLPYNKSTWSLFWLEPCGERARERANQERNQYAENHHDGQRVCLMDRHCFRETFRPGYPSILPVYPPKSEYIVL